jgi:serine/threonine protein kinase
MAPEAFADGELDLPALDIWSCGILFLIFYFQRLPWEQATCNDSRYVQFTIGKHQMLILLPSPIASCILPMLEINSNKRFKISDIYKNEWFASISTRP